MTVKKIKKKVFDLAEDLAIQEGLEVVDVEISGSSGRYIVRIYIDAEGGITISDCASFSRNLGALLEIEDPVPSAYFLEVSSPGIERVLRKPSHFDKYLGERARIEFVKAVEGRRKVTGEITEVTPLHVVIRQGENQFDITYENIKKARLKIDYTKM